MNIILGCDHGAMELKDRVARFLAGKGYSIKDMGVNSPDSVDYPDIARLVCREFLKGGYDFGILFCGTGIGISISANKIKGIRCALAADSFSARLAKEHNDANFLAFGGRVRYLDSPESMIESFVSAEFQGDRHSRRIDKITGLEDPAWEGPSE